MGHTVEMMRDGFSSRSRTSPPAWEGSRWSARSAARTNDLDADERRHTMTAGGGIEPCSFSVVAASAFCESGNSAHGFGLVVVGLVLLTCSACNGAKTNDIA